MQRTVMDALGSVIDSSSNVYSGATLTFYSLADVLQEVYTDTDYITPASTSGVLTANSSGRFPKAFFSPTLDYKAVLKDSSGATIVTINPIFKASGFLTSSSLTPYLLKAGGTMTGALNFCEGSAVTAASAIDLDAATGNMVHISGSTTIATMTLAQGAMRWLVFDSTPTLTHSSSLILPNSLDITCVAGDCALVVGEGSGVTRMLQFQCVNGKPLFESADILMAVTDATTNITTGTAKVTFRMPYAMVLTSIPRASLGTVQSAGSLLTIDINESGSTILSTKLTFDNSESSTSTATTPAVLSDSSLADNAEITVDIDQVGTAGAKSLWVQLIGYRRNR